MVLCYATLLVGANSTHSEELSVLFQVILELGFNKFPIISVVGANILAKYFGLAFKIMLGSRGLFSVGGRLKIDVTTVCGTRPPGVLLNLLRMAAPLLVVFQARLCDLPIMQLMHFGCWALQAAALSLT
jgi:hypothetical protein